MRDLVLYKALLIV